MGIALKLFVPLELAAVALATVGCDETMTCTSVGCGGGVEISLRAPDLPDGRYELLLDDGKTVATCTVHVGASADAGSPAASPTIEVQCDRLYNVVFDALTVVSFETPEHLHVTFARGDDTLLDEQVTPVYGEPTEPNGPGCGVCPGAASTILDVDPAAVDRLANHTHDAR